MAQEELKSSSLTIAGVIAALLAFALIVGLQALYYYLQNEELLRKEGTQSPARLRSLVSEDQKLLNGYRVVDRNAMVVAIPIDRAMELVARDLQASAPEKGGIHP